MKKIVTEIFIIVFGVTLSIQLQNWSEHKHEQEQVKTFLLGLKKDLQADIKDIKQIKLFYAEAAIKYTYLSKLEKGKIPNKDTLGKAISFLSNNNFLQPHKTRFSGFSSAGKLLTIENDELVQSILNYYQSTLLQLATSEDAWLSSQKVLTRYLTELGVDYEDTSTVYQALISVKGKVNTKRLVPWPQLLERYQNVESDAKEIITVIDKMYPENK